MGSWLVLRRLRDTITAMRPLNLGKQDGHGKQRRMEHCGKCPRASRTGGESLPSRVAEGAEEARGGG